MELKQFINDEQIAILMKVDSNLRGHQYSIALDLSHQNTHTHTLAREQLHLSMDNCTWAQLF